MLLSCRNFNRHKAIHLRDTESTEIFQRILTLCVLCASVVKILFSGKNSAAAFAEAYSAETFAFAVAFHYDLVAIFEEPSLLARR